MNKPVWSYHEPGTVPSTRTHQLIFPSPPWEVVSIVLPVVLGEEMESLGFERM